MATTQRHAVYGYSRQVYAAVKRVAYPIRTPYSYKVASGHVTFEWSSAYEYNLRMDSGSQDYR